MNSDHLLTLYGKIIPIAVVGWIVGNIKWTQVLGCRAQSQWLHRSGLGSIAEEAKWVDCKSQRASVCCETIEPSEVRRYTYKDPPAWLPEYKMNRRTTVNMPKWMRKSPRGSSPLQRTTDNRGKLGAGKVVPLREERTNWPSSAKWPALKTYTNNIT